MSEVACEQETLVTAWRQVGTICEETELNLALDQLVNYLGHPNPFICGLAFTELERLAVDKSVSTQDLFKPFWTTIAYSVVRDLHSRPQKAQQLCDLLQPPTNGQIALSLEAEIVVLLTVEARPLRAATEIEAAGLTRVRLHYLNAGLTTTHDLTYHVDRVMRNTSSSLYRSLRHILICFPCPGVMVPMRYKMTKRQYIRAFNLIFYSEPKRLP